MIAVSSPLSQVYNIPKMYKMHKRGLFISSLLVGKRLSTILTFYVHTNTIK